MSDAGELAESGAPQEAQKRFVVALSAAHRPHLMRIGDKDYRP